VKKLEIPERRIIEKAVRRASLAVRRAAAFGELEDLHRILAAGYAAAVLLRHEPSLKDLAGVLEARGGDPLERLPAAPRPN